MAWDARVLFAKEPVTKVEGEGRVKLVGVAIALTAMASAAGLLVGHGWAAEPDIVFSFVQGKDRIDVPAAAVRRLEAVATFSYVLTTTHERKSIPSPAVEICLSDDVRQRLCEMTRAHVGQTLRIVAGCEVVSEPVITNPICKEPCFRLSAFDVKEAETLADKLRRNVRVGCK